MIHTPPSRLPTRADDGAALVTVIGIIAVITVLAVTVATVSINNLRNATRDTQSNSALATSEAGVAEAIELIRSGRIGLAQLDCMEPAPGYAPSGTCLTNTLRWASASNPMQVRVDGGAGDCLPSDTCYEVWIGAVERYDPPLRNYGIYRIHSRGEFGGGPAARNVVTEIKVEPYPFPVGVFANTLRGNGAVAIRNESLYTTECVSQRGIDTPNGDGGGGLRFNLSGVDMQYDRPPGAHTTDETWSEACGARNKQPIHVAADCDPGRPFDRSRHGGALVLGDGCRRMWTSPATGRVYDYPQSSAFTLDDLAAVGYRPRGLSDAVYDVLEARARSTGTFWEGATAPESVWSSLAALNGAQAVVYARTTSATQEVKINPPKIPSAYFRTVNNTGPCLPSNLVIVVEGPGSLQFGTAGGMTSGDKKLVAALFVPDGVYVSNGNLPIIGSIFAKDMTVSGTTDFQLDQCFVDNPPSSVIDVKTQRFFEADDVN